MAKFKIVCHGSTTSRCKAGGIKELKLQQFLILVKGLKSVYTRDNFLPDEEAIKIWYALLRDIQYEVLNLAIQKYMMSEVFPPTIADLRSLAAEVQQRQPSDWGDGWEQVLRAIRKYGMYEPNKALESMDEITRKCVERLGFKDLCLSKNIMADRANFRMIYEELAKRQKQDSVLSITLKNKVMELQQKNGQKQLLVKSNK